MNFTTNNPANGIPPNGSNPTPPASPTLAQIAAEVSSGLTALMAQIPDLLISHPRGKNQLRGTASVPIPFITKAMQTVEASPDLQAVNKLDLTAAQNAVDYVTAFEVIIKQLEKAAIDLRFSADSKKAVAATEALQVYDLAKGLARDASGVPLITFVDEMKVALGRRGKKKTPPVVPPASPTAPTPVAAPPSVSLTATVPSATVQTTTHS